MDDDMIDLEPIKESPVTPAVGIGALALNFALKYHNINTVQDGTLYQQYKLEGKNMSALHLNDVFETAIAMEKHLLATSDRIAAIVVDAISSGDREDEEASDKDAALSEPQP